MILTRPQLLLSPRSDWLTDILNVLWESPCSLAAQWPSVEVSMPGSVCQSTAPIQPSLLPQLSAFLPKQTPHCHAGLRASPLHFHYVNERLAVHLRQRQAGGESPINQCTPSLAPWCHSGPSVLCIAAMYVLAFVWVVWKRLPGFVMY